VSIQRVTEIVARYSNKPVSENAAIFQDLDIYGIDAWELLGDLSDAFPVSFDGFDFDAYFPSDLAFFPYLKRDDRPRLTTQQLAELVASGKHWNAFIQASKYSCP
jgi:hypothetical protein